MPRTLLFCSLLFALILAPPPSHADGGLDGSSEDASFDLSTQPPTAFLGHHGLLVARDEAEGGTLYVYDLTSHELRRLADDIDCKGPKISPDGTRVVYHHGGALYLRPLAGGQAEQLVAGYDGHFWRDGAGEEWVYYTTVGDDPTDVWRRVFWPQSQGITTRRRRLRDGKDEHVLDWKGSGGPSPDGTHIAAGYATVAIFDEAGEPHFLNNGEQGCNTSLSPDERYLLMFFPGLGHERIAVVDKEDRLRWELSAPFGVVRWENPEWSNHPRFAAVSGVAGHGYASVFLIELPEALEGAPTPRQGLLQLLDARQGNHDWREPTLWVDWQRPPLVEPGLDGGVRDASGDAGVVTEADGCRLAPRAGGAPWPLLLLLVVAVLRLRRL